MNSDEIWLLQLWSGTFGASIGAIAAAGVALLLGWRSNKHQLRLAALARRQAAALAEEQLASQERSLRQQLDDQRAEASKARYFEAIGAFVATVEAGRSGFTSVIRTTYSLN
ncbi:hypothetical protein [[Micrococcus luteus] ATCC 49442]|uniref:hypothetical protein n=1 Tax=[Micrococcus luteus] ATCC 49442 TaxID=2698727 RepID=UPI0013DB0D55|nr:hypothetical protein [[Micrococcus luteus] ATCC 49442]